MAGTPFGETLKKTKQDKRKLFRMLKDIYDDVFKTFFKKSPDQITIDAFSSFEIYGLLISGIHYSNFQWYHHLLIFLDVISDISNFFFYFRHYTECVCFRQAMFWFISYQEGRSNDTSCQGRKQSDNCCHRKSTCKKKFCIMSTCD